jgi:hypothetical protein
MPEHAERLKATVRELEAELAELDSLDHETRAALEEAVREIQAALQGRHEREFQAGPFSERLQEAAARFESTHPTLFGIVSRTIDALGQIGI